MEKFLHGKLIIYLVASVIPLLFLSIFLADLVCTSLAIYFIFLVIKYRIEIIYKNIFFVLSLFFYLILLLSSLLSNEILFSLKSSFPFFRIIFFCFLLSYLISNNKNFLSTLYQFTKCTFIILVLCGLLEYISTYSYLYEQNYLDRANIRLNLFISDEQKLGSYLIRLFGFFLALHIIKKNKTKSQNLFFLILTILTFLIILLSGERNSLFFLILLLLGMFILLNISYKIKLISFVSVLILFTSFLYFNQNLSKRIIFDQNNQFKLTGGEIIIFTPQHTAHYLTAFNMFLDKPILGHGPKIFRIECSNKKYSESVFVYDKFIKHEYSGCSSHPHNTYLQLMAESGIVGTLLFTSGFLFIILNFFKHLFKFFFRVKHFSNYEIVICLSTLIIFWPFSPAGNFFNNWLLILSSFPLSLFINKFFLYKKK